MKTTAGLWIDHLDQARLGGNIIALETVDKMTDRQVAAKIREDFDGNFLK